MKKVINASVGGRSFAFDEDAYNRLSVYFDHFKARLNRDTQSAKDEVMSDLESRIAELFDEGIGGASYRVVDFALVSKVVGQLGMPEDRPADLISLMRVRKGRRRSVFSGIPTTRRLVECAPDSRVS